RLSIEVSSDTLLSQGRAEGLSANRCFTLWVKCWRRHRRTIDLLEFVRRSRTDREAEWNPKAAYPPSQVSPRRLQTPCEVDTPGTEGAGCRNTRSTRVWE